MLPQLFQIAVNYQDNLLTGRLDSLFVSLLSNFLANNLNPLV